MSCPHRCKNCGRVYECQGHNIRMSEDFCPDCREPVLNDVISAEKESYRTFRREGDGHWTASEKAYEFANNVQRERVKRGQ